MRMQDLFGRIMGFLVIIITLALGPTIYTANALVSGHTSVANCTGMSTIAGFGAFIIIFGLLTSGGLMVVMGRGGAGMGKMDFLKVIGSVILIVIALAFMVQIMTYTNTLRAAANTASDTLGVVGFSIIPIIVYVGILGLAGWAHVTTIRKMRRGRRSRYARAYL